MSFNKESGEKNDLESNLENVEREYAVTYNFRDFGEDKVFYKANSKREVLRLFQNDYPKEKPDLVETRDELNERLNKEQKGLNENRDKEEEFKNEQSKDEADSNRGCLGCLSFILVAIIILTFASFWREGGIMPIGGQKGVLNKDAIAIKNIERDFDEFIAYAEANDKTALANMAVDGRLTQVFKGEEVTVIEGGVGPGNDFAKINLDGEVWYVEWKALNEAE